jgi:hypothetical protein
MKLRIARKMDTGGVGSRRLRKRQKRTWWLVYTHDQLERAERRLRHSWTTHRRPGAEPGTLTLTPDWFAANRVQSRRARQRAVTSDQRERAHV